MAIFFEDNLLTNLFNLRRHIHPTKVLFISSRLFLALNSLAAELKAILQDCVARPQVAVFLPLPLLKQDLLCNQG